MINGQCVGSASSSALNSIMNSLRLEFTKQSIMKQLQSQLMGCLINLSSLIVLSSMDYLWGFKWQQILLFVQNFFKYQKKWDYKTFLQGAVVKYSVNMWVFLNLANGDWSALTIPFTFLKQKKIHIEWVFEKWAFLARKSIQILNQYQLFQHFGLVSNLY